MENIQIDASTYNELLKLKELSECANEYLMALKESVKYNTGKDRTELLELGSKINVQQAFVDALKQRIDNRIKALQNYSELFCCLERKVFCMRFMQGKKIVDIAKELNYDYGTIRVSISKIYKKLRKYGFLKEKNNQITNE